MKKKICSIIIGCLPFNFFRIFLYRLVLGYKISYDTHIGWANIICCDSVSINKGKIGNFNRIQCNSLILDNNAEIRKLNLIRLVNIFHMFEESGVISRNSFIGFFVPWYKDKEDCNIIIGKKSLVTINHSIDATRQVEIGDNVVFGGKNTQIWTHGFDIERNMVTGSVTIGNIDGVYIGSRCTICQGVSICDRVVIGAATCVSKSITESGFYVSSTLIRKSDIKSYEKK